MTATTPSTETLAPSYTIPVVLVLAAAPLLLVNVWLAGAIALFGGFLMVQTATLRLQFTPIALEVYRSGQQIRCFPYTEWSDWQIFWPPVPILFYFKEVNSIHFLPIIFNAQTLRSCLEARCPQQGRAPEAS